MPITQVKPLITLKAPPNTQLRYPGLGTFSVEFSALVVSPIAISIRSVRNKIRAVAQQYANELAAQSPRGATGNLRSRWKVRFILQPTDSRYLADALCVVSNTAPASYFRITGRAPGKLPPIRPIMNWARSKGMSRAQAYAIQRKIAKFGTARYRSGSNMAGFIPGKNPNTTPYGQLYRKDNIVTRFLERVAQRLA
jgi:hypothetical protein